MSGVCRRDLGWLVRRSIGIPSDVRCSVRKLDAAFFHLYGVSRDEVEHVLSSFWIVREQRRSAVHGTYQTKDLILEAYRWRWRRDARSPIRRGGSICRPAIPSAAHPPRPGEEPGHWIPWPEVLARAAQAAPAARSARTAAAPAAKPSPANPTRAIPEPAPSLFAPDPASAWQPEAAVAPSEIVMGARVRHRAKGEGTVLSVRPSGQEH